jgi:16S rRNA (cytosine1402-N4)-methyltransferase
MGYNHVPVMEDSVISSLRIRADGTYADGTIGGGGHASLVCERLAAEGTFLGIDRDEEAIRASEPRLSAYVCRKVFALSEFAEIKGILAEHGIGGLDGALLDLGVSSRQLDTPERGFSYMADAPLDMRMGKGGELTARDVVNGYTMDELVRIMREYGEERWASRIAAFIEKERAREPIETTGELVRIIKAAIPASARRDGPHPAKRAFQAIRIEVNDELGQLTRAVDDFVDVLNPGGRLAVITFHSLEDRIVKDAFKRRENPCVCPPGIPVCACGRVPDARRVNRKPLLPSAGEVDANPRARSAKLRVIERL